MNLIEKNILKPLDKEAEQINREVEDFKVFNEVSINTKIQEEEPKLTEIQKEQTISVKAAEEPQSIEEVKAIETQKHNQFDLIFQALLFWLQYFKKGVHKNIE